jgi:hypothetical protein
MKLERLGRNDSLGWYRYLYPVDVFPDSHVVLLHSILPKASPRRDYAYSRLIKRCVKTRLQSDMERSQIWHLDKVCYFAYL